MDSFFSRAKDAVSNARTVATAFVIGATRTASETAKAVYEAAKSTTDKPTEFEGATEDNTAICKTLRAYYDEQQHAYPAWLPPDPKRAPVAVAVKSQPRLGSGYGATGGEGAGGAGGGADFSTLWDRQQAQQQGRQSSQSLRQKPLESRPPPQAQAPEAHLLPSQRNGSSQQFRNQPPAPDKGRRLKERFGGNKTGRPPPANTANIADSTQQGRQASYNSTSSGSSYDNRSNGGSYGRSGGQNAPIMSANSPWERGDSGYTAPDVYPVGQDDGQIGGRRPGLPTGPGAGRRGLPNGPRSGY